jgi:hypothetical protein
MKIIKLILVIATITLITCKSESLSMKNNKDNFSENPIAGVAVPNDNYILQQAEVIFPKINLPLFLLNLKINQIPKF